MPLLYLTLSALLGTSPAPSILLLADPAHGSLEQQMVHQALTQELWAEGSRVVLCAAPESALERAQGLRSAARAHLKAAGRWLAADRPQRAATEAARAVQKLDRVAALSGDISPLAEALATEAAARLRLARPGQRPAARALLMQLYVVAPGYEPQGPLFGPAAAHFALTVRGQMAGLPSRTLWARAPAADSAIFVDGLFAGFGSAHVRVPTHLAHFVWILPRHGEAVGSRVVPEASPLHRALELQLAPRPAAPLPAPAAYGSIFAALATQQGFVEPHLPYLLAANVGYIWMLGDHDGILQLTCLDLARGRRTELRLPLAVSSLADARRAAHLLLAEAQTPPP